MDPREEQVAAWLKETARWNGTDGTDGNGPAPIDAGALAAAVRSRRRRVPAMLATASVVVLAIGAAIGLAIGVEGHRPSVGAGRGSAGATVSGGTAAGGAPAGVGSTAADPRGRPVASSAPSEAEATRAVEATIASVPVLPGAVEIGHAVAGLTRPLSSSTTLGTYPVVRTRWWTASGTLDAAVAWFDHHPPAGYTPAGGGTGNGPGGETDAEVDLTAPGRPDLEFSIVPYAGGVAVRADASFGWVPSRASWSLIGSDLTSIAVTVTRTALNAGRGGAPTVHRVLTGAAARRLARQLDGVPGSAPEGAHSCPAQLVIGDDHVVVHRATGELVFDRSGGGCAVTARVSRSGSADAFVAGADFTTAVLRALGLPSDYGYR